jgi:hypothetical protein
MTRFPIPRERHLRRHELCILRGESPSYRSPDRTCLSDDECAFDTAPISNMMTDDNINLFHHLSPTLSDVSDMLKNKCAYPQFPAAAFSQLEMHRTKCLTRLPVYIDNSCLLDSTLLHRCAIHASVANTVRVGNHVADSMKAVHVDYLPLIRVMAVHEVVAATIIQDTTNPPVSGIPNHRQLRRQRYSTRRKQMNYLGEAVRKKNLCLGFSHDNSTMGSSTMTADLCCAYLANMTLGYRRPNVVGGDDV